MRTAWAGLLALALLAGCDGGSAESDDPPSTTPSGSSASTTASTPTPTGGEASTVAPGGRDDPHLDDAVSRVREDSYYPDVGEPDIDALHYDLDLSWDPDDSLLSGVASIAFRVPADTSRLQLDLGDPLEPSEVRLDGLPVDATHPGKDLVVKGVRLEAGTRHMLRVVYAGSPEAVPAPTTRRDVEDVGWHTTDDGGAWTMQEPFGAYTWYPVNDQPSDKAYFDLTIDTPDSMRGVSGGEMVSDVVDGGRHLSSFHLAEPASSYLTTIAIGDYEQVTDTGPGGLPLTYWVLPDQEEFLEQLEQSPELIGWLTDRLGPFPFPTAGVVLVPSTSGMETQETITMGAWPEPEPFLASLLHEYAHQWYGDTVTPRDWSDLWLNESFAMYLQLEWMADVQGSTTTDRWVSSTRRHDQELRDDYGPPGAYDEGDFASPNVYYCGALMLHELGLRAGAADLGRLLRSWPQRHANANVNRGDWITFAEHTTDEQLGAFVRDWLLSERTPRS